MQKRTLDNENIQMTLNLSLQNLPKEMMVRIFPLKMIINLGLRHINLGLLQIKGMTQSLVGKAIIRPLGRTDIIIEVIANLCLNLTMIVIV